MPGTNDTLHAHWEGVYRKRAPAEVSWHQDTPSSSLALIEHCEVGPDAAILDVGGGASLLVDALLARGCRDVTVLDLSETALGHAKARLGPLATRARWIAGDVRTAPLGGPYEVWHDRAAFHFLVSEDDRALYRAQLRAALRPHGHVIVATFALDGPERCSGLPVVRYSPATLGAALGDALVLAETWDEEHLTPDGRAQRFVFCRFQGRG